MVLYRMPTFMIFKAGKEVEKVRGADPRKLQDVVKKLAAEAQGSSSGFGGASGSGSTWRLGDLPRGYNDVTDQVDIKGLELLNADSDLGTVRTLVDSAKPTGLQKGKAAASAGKDWVESDTDEQLMLFMPFQALLKVHTLQVDGLDFVAGMANADVSTDHLPSSHLRRGRRSANETEDHPAIHESCSQSRLRRGGGYPGHSSHHPREQGLG